MYGLKHRNSASLLLASLLFAASSSASDASAPSFEQRVEAILDKLSHPIQSNSTSSNTVTIPSANVQYQNCQNYPYHNTANASFSHNILTNDIKKGLKQGLACLSGNSSAGRLHP